IVYAGVVDYLIPAYRVAYAYVQTEATVVETAIDAEPRNKESKEYHPKVRLRYEAGGQGGEERGRLDWSRPYEDRERAEIDLRGYPVGARVVAWYDPGWT